MAHPYIYVAAGVLGVAALLGVGLPGDDEGSSGPVELLPPTSLSSSDLEAWCSVTEALAEAHREGGFFVHPDETFSRFVERMRKNPASLVRICELKGVTAAEFLTWTREIGSARKLAVFAERLESERESSEIAATLVNECPASNADPLSRLTARQRLNLALLREHLEEIEFTWAGLLHPHREMENLSATINGS